MPHRSLETPRLLLPAMTVEDLTALIEDDRQLVASGLVYPHPFRPPPENADVLVMFREEIRRGTEWPPRWVVRRADRHVLGSAGLVTPDADGIVLLGYAVYPEFEGHGYASEAALALVGHALRQPGVARVRATIHAHNLGSRKVATRAGLVHTGEIDDPTEGRLEVWENTDGAGPR